MCERDLCSLWKIKDAHENISYFTRLSFTRLYMSCVILTTPILVSDQSHDSCQVPVEKEFWPKESRFPGCLAGWTGGKSQPERKMTHNSSALFMVLNPWLTSRPLLQEKQAGAVSLCNISRHFLKKEQNGRPQRRLGLAIVGKQSVIVCCCRKKWFGGCKYIAMWLFFIYLIKRRNSCTCWPGS